MCKIVVIACSKFSGAIRSLHFDTQQGTTVEGSLVVNGKKVILYHVNLSWGIFFIALFVVLITPIFCIWTEKIVIEMNILCGCYLLITVKILHCIFVSSMMDFSGILCCCGNWYWIVYSVSLLVYIIWCINSVSVHFWVYGVWHALYCYRFNAQLCSQ